ncbi:hypothetical protein HZF08_04825 [Paenibacillus sp. CGMCC 1.16610]|uniref:Uncharacterized protein n=1 Tax=Paenibacillus anseongense TaxID=2682845 RepID=A0ABW9UFM9_9BACL|nr:MULTISPECIES: hypothetical protein [Paenibacillus]MBA2937617.1 hypothetical protein [Paenibacillus sp. CGMCC 1.16610]MVQ36675.1 hypothetical protein [Paenibacillus anseongense]
MQAHASSKSTRASSTSLEKQSTSSKMADQPSSSMRMPMNASSVLQLQRTIGNKEVARMMSQQVAAPTTSIGQPAIQRKLVAQYSDSLKRSATTSDLLQAFELIGMKSQILSAKANARVNPSTFNAILEQEIDEADFTVQLAKDKWEQSRDQISQLASNVLQKLYLDPTVSNDDGETDIFYDAVEDHTSKEDILPRLEDLRTHMHIFPGDMKTKLLNYYAMASLSKPDSLLTIDMAAIEEMESYVLDFSKNILQEVKRLNSRIAQDATLARLAPQLQDYLNTFLFVKAEDLGAFPLKEVSDNLAFLSRRIESLEADFNAEPKPEVYIHQQATDEALDKYVNMVHNNWNAGRNNPTRDTPAKHTHVEGYSTNMIFSMQNGSKDLYIHGVVAFHMDSTMSSSEAREALEIEDRSQSLANFIAYMPSGGSWITKDQWYLNKIAQYFTVEFL